MTDDLDNRWRPLSLRESGDHAAYDALDPGVPFHLRTSLWKWVASLLPTEDDLLRVERKLRIDELVALRHETWVVASQSCASVSLPQPAGGGTELLAEFPLSRPDATA